MHRRRGGKVFSLSSRIQVRTNVTATKRAVSTYIHSQTRVVTSYANVPFRAQVSAQPTGWGFSSSRQTAPPSPLTPSTPAGIGKWSPPTSKWAKPEPQKPPVNSEVRSTPVPRGPNPQIFLTPNRRFGPKPSTSLTPPRGASAPGKWSRSPGFAPPHPPPSIYAEFPVNESIVGLSKVPKVDFRREQEPKLGESSRQSIRPQEDEYAVRQPRRWEGNGKFKTRGSLLLRREGDDVIPRRTRFHDVKTTPKPRTQKAKQSLRINPDINIPSTVSVGNFARLLNVSLGMDMDLGLFD